VVVSPQKIVGSATSSVLLFCNGVGNACCFTNISQPNQIQLPTATGILNCLSKSYMSSSQDANPTLYNNIVKITKFVLGAVCHVRTTPLRTTDTVQAEGGNPVSTILPLPCGLIHPAGNPAQWVFRNWKAVSTPGPVHVQPHANYLLMFPSHIYFHPALVESSLYFYIFSLDRLTQQRSWTRI